MKRTVAFILFLCLIFSLFSFSAFAITDAELQAYFVDNSEERKLAKQMFEGKADEDVAGILLASLLETVNRGLVLESQAKEVIALLNGGSAKALTQSEYYFGQGTYIVGTDLQAGTYDIICESTANDSYTSSMNDFSGMYSEYGLGDYFNALGGMMESLDKMSVKLINSKGWTEKYLDLNSGESARIILEDGMKIDIADGTAKLTFIR